MVQPNILFPVPCSIQSLDRTDTYFDEELREPVQSEQMSATIICPGQVMWINQGRLDATAYGATEQSDGYVLFRYIDLKARNLDLKREDRFIKLGTIPCDLYVVSLQPIGHWPDLGGPGMVKAFFKDRQKSRNSPGV